MTLKKEFLEAGRIVNTHGVRGEVKIEPWCDSADFLRQFKTIYLDGQPLRMLSSRVHKEHLIARLEGVDDVDAAMRLKNRIICIRRSDAHLEPGAWFVQDMLGASVCDESGAELGKLKEVLDLPAGKVYVVQGEREILIPAVDEFVLNVDPENAVMTVRLIEGM